MIKTILFTIAFLLIATPVGAQGTPEEAKNLALEAVTKIHREGTEKALVEFNSDPAWKDRDLYVVVIDDRGVCNANANVPSMTGMALRDLKDIDGKPFVQDIINVRDTDWVEYKWLNPVTKKISTKKAYVIRVGERVVFVGIYPTVK
jgi:signal transduction histidine kinase